MGCDERYDCGRIHEGTVEAETGEIYQAVGTCGHRKQIDSLIALNFFSDTTELPLAATLGGCVDTRSIFVGFALVALRQLREVRFQHFRQLGWFSWLVAILRHEVAILRIAHATLSWNASHSA